MLMTFERVSYTYPHRSQPALNEISLSIPVGKRCALLGQNGSGKTTLFRLANGLYRPQRGCLRWQGQVVAADHASRTRLRQWVGLVFQNPEQQLVATTVEEDLSYGLCNLGLPEAEIADRVTQALNDFHLVDLADTPVHYLSLGQKKRLAIADIMILHPQLLLLDEPTAYLDPRTTQELITHLNNIHAQNTTILLASHDLNFVYDWAEWVFVIDRGQLVISGTPDEVFAQRKLMHQLYLGLPLALTL